MAQLSRILVGLIGLLSLVAAAQHWCNVDALVAAILLPGGALLDRFVSVAMDGYSAWVGSPMLVEALVIAICLFAYWSWGKKPEGL